jgi:putative transposase
LVGTALRPSDQNYLSYDMNLEANRIYHIYNQGNRKQPLFYKRDHYLHFLKHVRKYVSPNSIILAYCLMPNHYHFLIQTTEKSIAPKKVGNIMSSELSNGFRMLQSTFAQVINTERSEVGSLFKQKAQAKEIDKESLNLIHVYNYIHQNPVAASLVSEMGDWEFSSYRDFAGLRNGTLCNKQVAFTLTGFEERDFPINSLLPVKNEVVKKYFSF